MLYKYLDYLKEYVYFMPFAKHNLKHLAKKFDLYLVSNGNPDTQARRLEVAGIRDYFKKVYLSEGIGYRKPDVRYFDYVLLYYILLCFYNHNRC